MGILEDAIGELVAEKVTQALEEGSELETAVEVVIDAKGVATDDDVDDLKSRVDDLESNGGTESLEERLESLLDSFTYERPCNLGRSFIDAVQKVIHATIEEAVTDRDSIREFIRVQAGEVFAEESARPTMDAPDGAVRIMWGVLQSPQLGQFDGHQVVRFLSIDKAISRDRALLGGHQSPRMVAIEVPIQ